MRELRGPLALVGGVAGVGWDEYVVITLADGSVRHALVLDVNRDVALVQVMEGTSGMDAAGPHTGSVANRCASRWEPPGWAAPATAAANRSTAARR